MDWGFKYREISIMAHASFPLVWHRHYILVLHIKSLFHNTNWVKFDKAWRWRLIGHQSYMEQPSKTASESLKSLLTNTFSIKFAQKTHMELQSTEWHLCHDILTLKEGHTFAIPAAFLSLIKLIVLSLMINIY